MAIVSVDNLEYSIGPRRLLHRAGFAIEPGERVCLLGRNGEGKSTLLNILTGELAADDGTIQWQSGSQPALVAQEPHFANPDCSAFDAVAEGLGDLAVLVKDYHDASLLAANKADSATLATLEDLQKKLEAADGWRLEQRVDEIVSRLQLPADQPVSSLSGGWQRRVALARALVRDADLLLLDEPTNHLDIEAIEWLEGFLLEFGGAVLFVTHDRQLLRRIATRILELDRGTLTSWPGNYDNYLRRLEERQNAEAKQDAEFDKKLLREETWIRQGIKARRTRNEGRVRALKALREQRRARVVRQGVAKLELGGGDQSGKLVIEARKVGKRYDGKPVIDEFSCRILRGDRIGLLGPNGVGKTTLLKLLLGEIEPDSGTVRQGTKLVVSYYDQHRATLRDEQTAIESVADGSDHVDVGGRSVHVISYLERFLFNPERARTKVSALSGGERNRLLLARLFTKPANLLVLDEPTNDLDLETLEVLEDVLMEFEGTLLLVSHDRAFMDNVVTATLAFEGQGHIQAYVGGYQDWLQQRAAAAPANKTRKSSPPKQPAGKPTTSGSGKLGYKEQRELETLPARIETLESDLASLQVQIAAPDFYQGDAAAIKRILARLQSLEAELTSTYGRWEELETGSQ